MMKRGVLFVLVLMFCVSSVSVYGTYQDSCARLVDNTQGFIFDCQEGESDCESEYAADRIPSDGVENLILYEFDDYNDEIDYLCYKDQGSCHYDSFQTEDIYEISYGQARFYLSLSGYTPIWLFYVRAEEAYAFWDEELMGWVSKSNEQPWLQIEDHDGYQSHYDMRTGFINAIGYNVLEPQPLPLPYVCDDYYLVWYDSELPLDYDIDADWESLLPYYDDELNSNDAMEIDDRQANLCLATGGDTQSVCEGGENCLQLNIDFTGRTNYEQVESLTFSMQDYSSQVGQIGVMLLCENMQYFDDVESVCEAAYGEDAWLSDEEADMNTLDPNNRCCNYHDNDVENGGATCTIVEEQGVYTGTWGFNYQGLCESYGGDWNQDIVDNPFSTPDGSDGCCGDDLGYYFGTLWFFPRDSDYTNFGFPSIGLDNENCWEGLGFFNLDSVEYPNSEPWEVNFQWPIRISILGSINGNDGIYSVEGIASLDGGNHYCFLKLDAEGPDVISGAEEVEVFSVQGVAGTDYGHIFFSDSEENPGSQMCYQCPAEGCSSNIDDGSGGPPAAGAWAWLPADSNSFKIITLR